ncbi:hypothetical protein GSY74_09485 [Sulfurovum sp. bin170]|uniref:hypothetical protein n=1 Tax=Sulfurovum sp. bin170 TaxID=2695268 RepID=UPI0013E09F3F|nr:hypothetical protein [Sulfurovum sp. bin170]NEW61513.1 hypothetical protein [Sulfurovum sp. bin170]
MKKILLLISLSATLFSQDTLKEILENSNSFISGGIVHQNIDAYENTQALHLSYSYMNFDRWGFDTGYAQSFYKGKHQSSGEEKNFSSAYLFATYLIPLSSSVGFKSKAGYARNKNADDGLAYGVELIFQLNQNSGFSLGFQKMDKHINYFMINTIYKL